jgi:hypothetical protein
MSISFTNPRGGAEFPFGEAVEFEGTVEGPVVQVDLTADGEFPLPTVTLRDGQWFVANRFHMSGERIIAARGFDGEGNEVASAETTIRIAPPDFGALVAIPRGINRGVTRARHATMIAALGRPGELTADCSPVTNARVRRLLTTTDVGPFRVTGLLPAVEALRRTFDRVRQREPDLFGQLGTAGMLCCRRVRRTPGRPPSRNFSNHSWGTAIDIKIRGALDPRGDGMTQLGLLMLHPFFNEERFFWGAGFSGDLEDSMHFEASDELVREWRDQGLLAA